MPPDANPPTSASPDRFLPRRREMETFAELLPLKGVEASSDRVINVWGEPGVGKSVFLSQFRESEIMLKSKVLWLHPTRDGKLDTIPEFIRACSRSLRYPAEPGKEAKTAEKLDRVQQGKVNPIVSDDSLLITRSNLAKTKKPYVNQAAAASVGRTENVRDDIEISVGLGESKANNQAEGFLDALPLQSLGTDLIILYLKKLDALSVTIVDWIRDYVIPAATRGAYRRSVVILLESSDPLKLAYPNESWGEWATLVADFRVYPLSEDDTYQHCLAAGIDAEGCRFVFKTTLGYPKKLNAAVAAYKNGQFEDTPVGHFDAITRALSESDRAKLAALCLPEKLYPNDLDALFGPESGAEALAWLGRLPDSLLQKSADGKSMTIPDPLRKTAIVAAESLTEFKPFVSRWTSLGKLIYNVPKKTKRSKILLLSSLNWLDEEFCEKLFGEQSLKVLDFIHDSPEYFNRNRERYRVSERIRPELQKVAADMQHLGFGPIAKKAESIWQSRKTEIEERIAHLESEIERLQSEANGLIRKQSESQAQSRIQERKTATPADSNSAPAKNRGPLVATFSIISIALFVGGALAGEPFGIAIAGAGVIPLLIAAVLTPQWLAYRRASQRESEAAQELHSSGNLRKQTLDITHLLQDCEARIDDLKADLANAKSELRFSYV